MLLGCLADDILTNEINRIDKLKTKPTVFIQLTLRNNYEVTLGTETDNDGYILDYKKSENGYIVNCEISQFVRIDDSDYRYMILAVKKEPCPNVGDKIYHGENINGVIVSVNSNYKDMDVIYIDYQMRIHKNDKPQ